MLAVGCARCSCARRRTSGSHLGDNATGCADGDKSAFEYAATGTVDKPWHQAFYDALAVARLLAVRSLGALVVSLDICISTSWSKALHAVGKDRFLQRSTYAS